ncbi:MAG: nitrate reductase [Desulfobacteraceae bacterium]|nr:MAG: nitrate reductase [Desulfobacteraceae bacterium]
MNAFIDFITGPMVWISFLIFFAGVFIRVFRLAQEANSKEKFMFSYFSWKYSLRSIFAWLVPFLPASTRQSPVFWGISYLFHLLLFMVPIFLLSHIVLLEESLGWSWISLNDSIADVLTVLVILALVFFAVRRLNVPEVKFLTRSSDYLFILIVALPFLTGFLAYHQFFFYRTMVIIHILTGELMLILIPFTRFFHMFLAPISRAYTGSEFGNVRQARDW